MGPLTVALDVNISQELMEEGIAREIVNRIQNIRKDKGYEVTDKIVLEIQKNDAINAAIANNLTYICAEILATNLQLSDTVEGIDTLALEVDENIKTFIKINKN
jgi:isoleucyl-tRNA synthetase